MLEMISKLEIPSYVIFFAVGYFLGSLFRDVGVLKIIAIILLVPSALSFMSQVDELLWVTFPILLGGLIGFWGINKTRYKLETVFYTARDLLGRFR